VDHDRECSGWPLVGQLVPSRPREARSVSDERDRELRPASYTERKDRNGARDGSRGIRC
jgi:hypothetical protein